MEVIISANEQIIAMIAHQPFEISETISEEMYRKWLGQCKEDGAQNGSNV